MFVCFGRGGVDESDTIMTRLHNSPKPGLQSRALCGTVCAL